MCDMNGLVISGTIFSHKTIDKETWISPDRRTRNQIGHVLINKRFGNSVKERVYGSLDLEGDYYLVCTTVKHRSKGSPTQRNTSEVKYDTSKLGNEDVLKAFNTILKNRYQASQ